MKKITLLVLFMVTSFLCSAQSVFINEIHYDNASTDVGEFIEIAGPAGTDLSGWQLELYNGSNGTVYDTEALTGTIPDEGAGFGALSFPITGIQNGAPDGVALINGSSAVVQFLSYEGSFMATAGTANGMTSTDIGVEEGSGTAVGESMQLQGTGNTYSDFTWASDLAESPGAINAGQTFNGANAPVTECATDTPKPIPASGPFGPMDPSPINVTETGVIGTAAGEYTIESVSLELNHTFDGDLDITLLSPDGTTLFLSDSNGGAGDNYTGTIFMDGGADINAASAPFTGTFEPEGGTFESTFAGENVGGNWTLNILDNNSGDNGTLLDWCITVSQNPISPIIACPSDVVANTDPGVCGAVVNFADAVAVDPEGGPVTVTQTMGDPSGSVFPPGVTIIEFTATDQDGDSSTCQFTITITDNEDPTITCGAAITQTNDPGMCGADIVV
ncbi:MAG: proprotein convertase P-domain-containing protein, partial [Flavobacteriales bacterium]|nr:proprotein convertase P-domain-containing protein [Flavobacteriales bacterium]